LSLALVAALLLSPAAKKLRTLEYGVFMPAKLFIL
jgi:hypothetical protein